MVMDPQHIDSVYHLHHEQRWSIRKIARHLHLSRKSVKKYLQSPLPVRRKCTPRESKLDRYKPVIREFLDRDSKASAVVIAQRLVALGYTGQITILRDYLQVLRRTTATPRAFVRVETSPGDRFEIDWGHFGALDYQGDRRKLYAFCLIECHSRRLYVEFTHSQCFESFARCHIQAFRFMTGTARECVYDNLATAVAEHDGRLVRFNPRFLAFAREFGFYPRACNVAAAWEKGRIERAGVGYLRQNFWPLRTFTDLEDVNRQAQVWLQEVANRRIHSETRQSPEQRFRPETLRPLPALDPDYRDTDTALVHKDIRLAFDGNKYCVPARFVGHHLTIKADSSVVTVYDGDQQVVRYPRCWQRRQTLGAERFQRELLEQRPAARCSEAQQRLVLLLGQAAEEYLRHLADTDRSLARQIRELLELVRQYGSEAVTTAIKKAQAQGAFGADYIANILRQEHAPRSVQPPLQLRDPRLNELATDPLSLLEYDAFILDAGSRDAETSESEEP